VFHGLGGVSVVSDDPRAVSYEEVLTIADRGLNRAKQSGKNCAVGMSPATGHTPATTVARRTPRPCPLTYSPSLALIRRLSLSRRK